MSKKYLILTVDDESDIRESVKDVLEDEGYEVEMAVNGQDCLDKLKKIKPDLILLDILMPGLVTKKIIEGIRKKYPKMPVIFLTVVRLSEATKQKIVQDGMADYMEKPFDNADLVKRVKRALGRYG